MERRRGAHVCYEQPLWPAALSPRGPRSPQHWGLSRETTGGRGAGPRLLGKHGQAVGLGPWSGDPVHGPQFSRQAAAWHGPWAPAAEWGRDGHSGFMRPGGSPLRLSLVITENLHPTRTHTHTHSQTRAATSSREPSWVGPLDPATPGVTWSTALASGPQDSLGLCRERPSGLPGWLGTALGATAVPRTYLTHMTRLCTKEQASFACLARYGTGSHLNLHRVTTSHAGSRARRP